MSNTLTAVRSTLESGESLQLGEALQSPNGRYRLELQAADGNLVLYHQRPKGGQHPIWATNTQKDAGHADFARELVMQADGNLVLYRAGNHDGAHSRWSSATNQDEHRGARLELQNDGNLVMHAGTAVAWSTGTNSHTHWMEDLDPNLTLQNVCVPGSHDGGMYYTSIWVGTGVALTQQLSVYEQLRQGSRYFDFRPNFVEHYIGTDDFYIHHGLADGHRVSVILQDLARFFNEGSQETVIAEFSHWKNFGGRDAAFVDLLLQHLPDTILLQNPAVTGIATMKLADLRGKLIVLIDNDSMYRDAVLARHKTGIHGRNQCLPIHDKYANSRTLEGMLDHQKSEFATFDAAAPDNKLFMLNWTLTPEEGASGLAGPSVADYASRINPHLAERSRTTTGLFDRGKRHGRMVNIINLDFVETADAVPVCRELMARNPPVHP